jgi:hypothetical protein
LQQHEGGTKLRKGITGFRSSSNEVTAEGYERYCPLLEELASMLKKGDGEAVESFLFSAVDRRECLDNGSAT